MKQWAGKALAAAGIGILCMATGCDGFFVDPNSTGSGGTGSNTGDYVYVANASTQSLDVFSVGTNSLTSVISYSLGFVPTAVVVNAKNTMVVVAGAGFIDTFSIASSGTLNQLNRSANTVASDIAAMDISPDGQWLVGVDQITSSGQVLLDEYQISSSGQLSQPTIAPLYVFPGSAGLFIPSAVKFAPNGQALYVAGGTAGDVKYSFNTAASSGLLTETQALINTPGIGADNALATSADSAGNTYIFIAHSNGSTGSLLVYKNDFQTPVGPMNAGTQPISVALNKDGTAVYVANQLSGSISGYSVTSGVLAALTNSPYSTASGTTGPRALVADNSGNYILAITNAATPYLAMYGYDATVTGQLDLITTGTEKAGAVAIAATH